MAAAAGAHCDSPHCRMCRLAPQPDAGLSVEDSIRLALESLSPSSANVRATRRDEFERADERTDVDVDDADAAAATDNRNVARRKPGRFAIRAPSLFDDDDDDNDNGDNDGDDDYNDDNDNDNTDNNSNDDYDDGDDDNDNVDNDNLADDRDAYAYANGNACAYDANADEFASNAPSVRRSPGWAAKRTPAPASPTKRIVFANSPPRPTIVLSPAETALDSASTIVVDADSTMASHPGSSLAAREVEASGDFPSARAEFELNTHGSFLDTQSASATNVLSRSMLRRVASPVAAEPPSAGLAPRAAPPATALLRVPPRTPPRLERLSPARDANASGADDVDDAALLLHELERARLVARRAVQSDAARRVAVLARAEQATADASARRAVMNATAHSASARFCRETLSAHMYIFARAIDLDRACFSLFFLFQCRRCASGTRRATAS